MCPLAMASPAETIGWCVGSSCMAWRWGKKKYKKIKDEPCPDCSDAPKNYFCPRCVDEETYGRKQEFEIINRGYCGLTRQKTENI